MQIIFEIVLILTALLSFIPVIKMMRNHNDRKYGCLRALISATLFWTILILLERISSSRWIVYYAAMMGFPMRLLLATLMLCTIHQYVEKKMPRVLVIILAILVFVDIVIALSNSQTQYFVKLSFSEFSSFLELYQADYGSLFLYHLVISYVVAIFSIVLLFVFLAKQKSNRQYKEVTRMMAISVVIVLFFNLLQIFLDLSNVNLTYISLVIVAYSLYDVIYRKDMIFNLRSSGRGEILSNMREMYILTDSTKRIIEISPLLLEKYQLNDTIIGETVDIFKEKIAHKAILYSDYQIDDNQHANKDHYHLREKQFQLKGMKETGNMILLYDETQIYNLLRELNRLSHFDEMTGLNNRNYLEHKLGQIIDTSNIGVFSIDLNGLKINNDYFGHERGDFLLKTTASKLKEVFQSIPNKDIARIGGDEFVVLTYGVSVDVLESKKIALIQSCEHPDFVQKVSISVGLAFGSNQKKTIYQLVQMADAQMYEMKENASPIYKEEFLAYTKQQDRYIR